MHRKINIITTTSVIDGLKIDRYLGIVTSQAVQGTNIFSDLFAEVRDIVGGYSASYQNKLKEMEDRVIEELKKKALMLGANAIIGLRLDFDEISGKGKGMLMLTAQGTAVQIVNDKAELDSMYNSISFRELDLEIQRQTILDRIQDKDYRISDIESLETLELLGIYDFDLIVQFASSTDLNLTSYEELIVNYMKCIEPDQVSKYLTKGEFIHLPLTKTNRILELMEYIDWFDYEVVEYLLEQNDQMSHQKALLLLGFQKPEYTKEDIPRIESMIKKIETTFKNYPKIVIKEGMFGRSKEVWQCLICGKENDMTYEVCQHESCFATKYGVTDRTLTPESIIRDWSLKAEMIKKILR